MAKKLRFTMNDGDAFPIPLLVESLSFGESVYTLHQETRKTLKGKKGSSLHRVKIVLSQPEQSLLVDETMILRHIGHSLLVLKGAGDYQTLWFDEIEGFPPSIYMTYGIREHVLRDGNELIIYPSGIQENLLKIQIPTRKVHFRPSNKWKAQVIG